MDESTGCASIIFIIKVKLNVLHVLHMCKCTVFCHIFPKSLSTHTS